MSEILEEADVKVEIVKIQSIQPMEGKDRIELVWLYREAPYGESCIVTKGKHTVGELVCFIPPDHIVPDIPHFAFMNRGDNKDVENTTKVYVREKYRRVRSMKMGGYKSHGIILSIEEAKHISQHLSLDFPDKIVKEGNLIGDNIGVTRYYPEVKLSKFGYVQKVSSGQKKYGVKPPPIPTIPKYELTNIRHFQEDIFGWEEDTSQLNLIVTEKIHGCNARFVVTRRNVSLVKRALSFIKTHVLGLFFPILRGITLFCDKDFELHLSSRNVWKSYLPKVHRGIDYNKSVWKVIAEKYQLFDKLRRCPDLVFYGEIFGEHIQGGFPYGLDKDDIDFRVFEIYDPINLKWLSWYDVVDICYLLNLKTVPVLLTGTIKKCEAEELVSGKSIIDGTTMKEGIVIRTNEDLRTSNGSRLIAKWKSEEFLQKHS